MELVTGAKLAEMLGVSRKTVASAFHKGVLSAAGESKRGPLYNPKEAIPQYEKRAKRQQYLSRHKDGKQKGGRPRKDSKPKKPPARIPGDVEDIPDIGQFGEGFDLDSILLGLEGMSSTEKLDRADLAVKLARARLGALAVREKEGQLIAVERVQREGARLAARVNGALASIPGRLAQQFSAMTDANAIHELLENEINRAIIIARTGEAVGKEAAINDSGEDNAQGYEGAAV